MVSNAMSAGWVNWILTAAFIIFFAYFYTSIVFNHTETAENLQQQGGFIPGIRPGANTVAYLKNVMRHVILPGAIFIAIIAVVPSILFYFTNNALIQAFGGTSILIMIGVALEMCIRDRVWVYHGEVLPGQKAPQPALEGSSRPNRRGRRNNDRGDK